MRYLDTRSASSYWYFVGAGGAGAIISMMAPLVLSALLSGRVSLSAASRCLNESWPLFESNSSLASNQWGRYVEAIYGAVPTDPDGQCTKCIPHPARPLSKVLIQALTHHMHIAYPLCIGDSWMFYDRVVRWANITDIPSLTKGCPTHNGTQVGQRYISNNPVQFTNTSWSWHPPNASRPNSEQKPFSNNT